MSFFSRLNTYVVVLLGSEIETSVFDGRSCLVSSFRRLIT